MISTVILRTAGKILVPLSLVFAVYIYFKGHQSPGGGFVAGLVASVALIVHRMCEGRHSLRKLLPVPEHILIALGLALAMGTGLASLAFGLPFLSSWHGRFPIPGAPQWHLELASAAAFDLGVLLVVTGVVVGMISVLSDQVEAAGRS